MTMIGIRPEDRTNEAKETSNVVYQNSLKHSDSSQDAVCDSAEIYVAKSNVRMGVLYAPIGNTSLRSASDKPNLWDDFFAAAPLPDDFMEE